VRKIVEEALEAEVAEAVGRGYYENGATPGVVWISSVASLEGAAGDESETTETRRSAAQIALAIRARSRAMIDTDPLNFIN
jgi:hypothetical protein